MNIFIIKSLIFVAILVSILGIIEYRLRLIPNSYTLKRDCLKNNSAQLRYLILGTSQAQFDLDPAIFDAHGCSLANSSQDFYYDNQLLHKYIALLPRLKTVIIPVTYFSLGYRITDSDESWRQFFYAYFFQIKEEDPGWDIRQYSFISLYTPQTTLGFIYHRFNVSLISNNTTQGWFQGETSSSNTDKKYAKSRALLHTSEIHSDFYQENKNILEDSISLLKKHNVKVILIMLPVTSSYNKAINKKIYLHDIDYYQSLRYHYHINFYNYFQDNSFTFNEFSDGSDHLNAKAAKIFSNKIKNEILFHKNSLNH